MQPPTAQHTGEPDAAAAGADSDIVNGPSSACMVMQQVRIMAQPGAHSLLDFGIASLCYSVGGRAGQHGGQYGPTLVIQGTDAATSSCSAAGGSATDATFRRWSGRQPPLQPPDSHPATKSDTAAAASDTAESWEAVCERPPGQLDAGVEAAVCSHAAADAQALLTSFPTSIEEDEALLQQAGPEPGLNLELDPDPKSRGNWAAAWRAWTHRQLAIRYRLARKRLLWRTASDLDARRAWCRT